LADAQETLPKSEWLSPGARIAKLLNELLR
jgi:hypothetical protein